jgi:hypothetical protein
MNQREKILAGVVLAMVALLGGNALYGRYQKALDARRTSVIDAKTRLAEATATLAMGRSAVNKMERWQERSLPSDREKALTLYKAWLLTKAKAAGLAVNDIKLAPRTTASTAFEAIGYQMEATGTLSSVISMLYEFYHSPQLQQVTRLRLNRPPGAAQLQITLEVEALCLPGAIATDSLPEGDSKQLKLASVADYQKSLGERDLATVYTPPRPPGPPPVARKDPPAPPKFDESELAYFTAAVSSGKGMQAWINVRSTGETMHLVAGDAVKVGALDGQIESIEARSLVLKSGDKKYRVALGQSLRKGKELDANGEVKAEAASEPPKS